MQAMVKLIREHANETIMGVQYEYRFTLVAKAHKWALENKDRFDSEPELIGALVDKVQDIAAEEHYPLVSELFD